MGYCDNIALSYYHLLTRLNNAMQIHFRFERPPQMIKRYNNISLAIGAPGIILQIAGKILFETNQDPIPGISGAAMIIIGTAMLITGLAFYAKGKGQSAWFCLLGLLSIIGIIVLHYIPDNRPNG